MNPVWSPYFSEIFLVSEKERERGQGSDVFFYISIQIHMI